MFMKRLLIAFVLLGIAVSAAAIPPIGGGDSLRKFGPAPRLTNGRFTNVIGELAHGRFSIRFPFFMRRIAGSFRDRPGAPTRLSNDGAFLRDNANREASRQTTPTVTWVGHSTLLVQMDQVSFLTDPIWSETPSPISFAGPRRFVAPGIAIDDLPRIDFVVVSHNHYDHLDLPTLVALAERDADTRFFVPTGNGRLLRENGIERVEEFDWGEWAEVSGVRVHCLPSQHWSKRGLGDDHETLWASWAAIGPERSFYFAGDTGYFDGFSKISQALGPFDLAAVPIGAYEPREMMQPWHMNPEEAARAAEDLRARRAIGIHFGTFDLADEELEEPPRRFLGAEKNEQENRVIRWVFRIGETRFF